MHTCVLCRMHQVRYSLLGVTFKAEESNTECSSWYADHRPAHRHIWVAAPFAQDKRLNGTVVQSTTYNTGQAFWSVSTSQQLRLLEQIESTQDVRLQGMLDEVAARSIANDEVAARAAVLRLRKDEQAGLYLTDQVQ